MKSPFKFFLTIGICYLLSGCRLIALPGQEPFGEQTYSNDRAQIVYEKVRAEMETIESSDLGGYYIERNETSVSHDFYRTEEYTVAWHEGAGNQYLWYERRLYRLEKGISLAFRDMEWEELQSDDYALQQWEFAHTLLAQEAEELKYKYIPMSSGNQYLLTASYPETVWNGQARRFPKLSFQLDEDGNFSGFTLRWVECGSRTISISYFPYEHSTNLQAERKVWSFAHDLGLIEEGIPALSVQMDDREGSRSVIAGIRFEQALVHAEYRENLTFPAPPERTEIA